MLTIFSRPKDGQREDRFVEVCMQRLPPEKIHNKDGGKDGKNASTGFSPAALQELQLLTLLHSLIPSPTGHPNLTLPITVALRQEKEENVDQHESREFGETKVHDIFALFRSIEDNARSAEKEKKRRDRMSDPHIVFEPIPLILTWVKQRSRKMHRDDTV